MYTRIIHTIAFNREIIAQVPPPLYFVGYAILCLLRIGQQRELSSSGPIFTHKLNPLSYPRLPQPMIFVKAVPARLNTIKKWRAGMGRFDAGNHLIGSCFGNLNTP